MYIFRKRINGKLSRFYYGRWRIKGTVIERSLRVCTKSVAASEWRRLLSCFESDLYLNPVVCNDSITDCLDDFLSDLLSSGRSDMYCRNIRTYVSVVSRFCGWRVVSDLSGFGFVRWRNSSPLSPKSKNNYLLGWRSFSSFLISLGSLSSCPFAGVKRSYEHLQVKPRRALTEYELSGLFACSPLSSRVVYALAFYTGLRRSEIASLTWDDFVFGDLPYIRLRSCFAKNRRESVIPLRSDLADLLLEARRSGVSSFRLTDYKRDYINAGIELVASDGRRADFHSLRHSFCSFLFVSGASQRVAQAAMRHSDPRLTSVTYTDTSLLPLREALDRLPLFFFVS